MTAENREIAASLSRGLIKLNRRLRAERSDRKTSLGKLSILGRLYHDGAATPGALALAEGLQPQSLTRVLAELEEEGLVSRRQDEADRRQFRIELTSSGRNTLRKYASDQAAWLASAIASQLSPMEQNLLRLTAQLLDRLADTPCPPKL